MGHAHAISGAAAWVALAAPSPLGLALVDAPPGALAAGLVVTAGAALLPDADHHAGTIAHSLPPLSTALTRSVGAISGGHRHATHSLLGVAVAGALASALATMRLSVTLPALGSPDPTWTIWRWDIHLPHTAGAPLTLQVGAWLITVLLVAFGVQALRLSRGWISSWALSLVISTFVVLHAPDQLWWLPASVTLGCAAHLVGDLLTEQGIPLLWPINPKPPAVISSAQKAVVLVLALILAAATIGAVFAFGWTLDASQRIAIASVVALTTIALLGYLRFSRGLDRSTIWRPNGYLALPVLGTAGSHRESGLVVAMSLYLVLAGTEALAPGTLGTVGDFLWG